MFTQQIIWTLYLSVSAPQTETLCLSELGPLVMMIFDYGSGRVVVMIMILIMAVIIMLLLYEKFSHLQRPQRKVNWLGQAPRFWPEEKQCFGLIIKNYLRFETWPSRWFSSKVSLSEILFASLIVFSESESSILSWLLPPSISRLDEDCF